MSTFREIHPLNQRCQREKNPQREPQQTSPSHTTSQTSQSFRPHPPSTGHFRGNLASHQIHHAHFQSN
jgi:hypothetical protein